jgi:calcineurin-like phosphoesterase family protein
MNRWFIADLHFSHENIILYTCRNFKDVNDMTEGLIQNWNNTVKKRDLVFVLGDFSFYNKVEEVKAITDRLKGTKIIVLGNHDKKINTDFWKQCGFKEVYRYPIIYKDNYLLSHEPVTKGIGKEGFINIHGHIHNRIIDNPYYVNVSVEAINYKPISFDEIAKRFK